MGLTPHEVKSLYYKDFNLMLIGYQRRLEQDRNHFRHIMWAVINFSGMGAQTPTKPSDIWPLLMDSDDEKRMITNMSMALALLKEF